MPGGKNSLSEVLSLSTEGLFIKTSARLNRGDDLLVIIPLLGMNKELEINAKVLYRVDPVQENNYLAGVGLQFTELDEVSCRELQTFLEGRLLGDLATSPRAGITLSIDQLQSRSGLTLRMTIPSAQ
jgi:Tfp pilus assembly protein PilZ